MGKIALLDCTLRDGGYINDWEFGHDNLVYVFECLAESGVDMIEVGFLDERRMCDCNRSIMPDTDSVRRIFGKLDKKHAMILGMIDFGTCAVDNIEPCEQSCLDGIRVIFKKHLRAEAFEFCARLKRLGYKVFAQLVSITSYSDDELQDAIRLANEVDPYAVSIVDTYGLLHQDALMHYFRLLDSGLNGEIALGYHSHNNFQLGYANCIEMLSYHVSRDIVVDATLYGMGKSAGNTPIELLAMHLNEHYGKKYDISLLLEAIDAVIMNIYKINPWGYNMHYYMAASNDCHPNYVSYLLSKRTLSVKSVNDILSRLSAEKRLLYDECYIHKLYMDYQAIDIDGKDACERLKKEIGGRDILLLGPGNSLFSEKKEIYDHIKKEEPILIAINFMPDILELEADYLFLSNSKRYVQLSTALLHKAEKTKVIATSNLIKHGSDFDYVLKYSDLLDEEAVISDNPLPMILKVLGGCGAKAIGLAGFDGYSGGMDNYIDKSMEYDFTEELAASHNKYVSKLLADTNRSIPVSLITPSKYVIAEV